MILEINAIPNLCQCDPLNPKEVEKKEDNLCFCITCISRVDFVPHFNRVACVQGEIIFHLFSMCFGDFFHHELATSRKGYTCALSGSSGIV